MERLTIRNAEGNYAAYGNSIQDIIDRLAAYEDTGLEPERVRELKPTYERQTPSRFIATGSYADRASKFIEADDDGRLLVLPCKVGDTVYCLRCSRMRLDEGDINEILASKIHGVRLWVKFKNNGVQQLYTMQEIGQLVFLTREEAEKALEGME